MLGLCEMCRPSFDTREKSEGGDKGILLCRQQTALSVTRNEVENLTSYVRGLRLAFVILSLSQ